jgi:hypothetical protein
MHSTIAELVIESQVRFKIASSQETRGWKVDIRKRIRRCVSA